MVFATDGCSIAVVMMCFPRRLFARAAPKMARLFDSVPPEVKMISFGSQRSVFAIRSDASRT